MQDISSIVCEILQKSVPITGVTWSNETGKCTVNYKEEATEEQRQWGDSYKDELVAEYMKKDAELATFCATKEQEKEVEVTWEKPVPAAPAEEEPIS